LRLKGPSLSPAPFTILTLGLGRQANKTTVYRGLLKLKNQKPKYQITHPSGKIADAEGVTLKLHYNVQPWFGLLTWNMDQDIGYWEKVTGGKSDSFTLPSLKKKEGAKL
jgi:signal peptidase complex subunit 3